MKSLLNTIRDLLQQIAKALVIAILVIIVLTLALILALLRLLPYLLRAASIIAWIVGMGITLVATWNLYSAISGNPIAAGLTALLLAGLIAIIPSLVSLDELAWGAYAFAALCGWLLSEWANALIGRVDLYPLISLLPNAIAVTGIIALATNKSKTPEEVENEQH